MTDFFQTFLGIFYEPYIKPLFELTLAGAATITVLNIFRTIN